MNKSDLPRIYIAVDEPTIVRCYWCGTVTSIDWIQQRSVSYCSKDCMDAPGSENTLCIEYCLLSFMVFFVVLGIMFDVSLLFVSVFFGVALTCACSSRSDAKELAKRVPKGSRRTEVSDEDYLLQSIPHTVECPNYDGNIDLTNLGPNRIFKCEYCGTTGIVEIVHSLDK
ncbi:MAG: hypothetical protein RTU92_06475 [Candidatus Thorarchaeota archaeon]